MRISRLRAGAAMVALAVALVCAACADTSLSAPSASIDEPKPLTDAQAEALAAMPFKNFAAGVTAFEGQLFTAEAGDLPVTGWVDFTEHRGYAQATPVAAMPILVIWDEKLIAYLDVSDRVEDSHPTLPPPDGNWQVVPLEPETSELTRLLAAVMLLSRDRPENPLLLKQSGAHYLGPDELSGISTERFSGVVGAEDRRTEFDLGTQYWLDDDGDLVRFAIRTDGHALSTITFDRTNANVPEFLPRPEEMAGVTWEGGIGDD